MIFIIIEGNNKINIYSLVTINEMIVTNNKNVNLYKLPCINAPLQASVLQQNIPPTDDVVLKPV